MALIYWGMAMIHSSMVALGTRATDFTLFNTVDGSQVSLNDLKSECATVIMFICNHCPFVKHVNSELVRLANDYIPKGISFVAISSNDVKSHPEDSPENMKLYAERLGYPFAYLYDETQEVAKSYSAECTPDFFVYDKELTLVYRGQLDDSRPSNGKPVTGNDIRLALDAVLEGNAVDSNQIPSIGCNIKWKA